jgi:hypothetical protein
MRSLARGRTRRSAGLLALTLALGACSYTPRADGPEGPTTTADATTATVADGPAVAVTAQADLVRKSGGPAQESGTSLLIEPLVEAAVVSFPLGDIDPSCVASATLEATAVSDSGAIPFEAWVSLEQDADTIVDGQSLGGFVVASGSPSADSIRSDGTVVWDATELVAWSAVRYPDSRALVFALKPRFSIGDAAIELGSIEGQSGAVLRIAPRADCRLSTG